MSSHSGILLINLGTPDAPTPQAVARYLREFLMDPDVIDIPWPARALLVHGLIAPFRAPKSAHAYQSIWRKDGSPLKVFHLSLAQKVADLLAPIPIAAAMRYGQPSIENALRDLQARGATRILVFPLYPQYALASTHSSIEQTKALASKMNLQLKVIEDFHDHPEFIAAEVQVMSEALAGRKMDHYLFSFHGLPERHMRKAASPECLRSSTCCDVIETRNRRCYRAQCFKTAHILAQRLGLARETYSVAFQSRLGRSPWIQPFTDVALTDLAQKGVKRLAVLSPSFVADCLETLEEIEIRGRAQFLSQGGEELFLAPSLNDHPRWVEAVATMAHETLS